jgi:cysteine desulfurase
VSDVIYLDNNATTPIDKRVLDQMMPYLTYEFANANSSHQLGVNVNNAIKKARTDVADLIGVDAHEIFFTSGATESINIALKGIFGGANGRKKHIITVSTEHSATIDTCKYLRSQGCDVTFLPVEPSGLINLSELKASLRTDTILVSVMMANNETGVLQQLKQISSIAKDGGALFMSDTTQAIGKIPVDADGLGIDILCISSHKVYGPKGVGAIYVRQRNNRVKIPPLFHGGGHEKGLRSGTLNVPGIVGFGAACKIASKEIAENKERIEELRNHLEKELLMIPNSKVNGAIEHRLPNTLNILFEGVDSDALIMALSNGENNEPIIAVSNGSACTSLSIEPSHVLTEMGLSESEAFNSIRLSIGKFNTKLEIDVVNRIVYEKVQLLRAMKN